LPPHNYSHIIHSPKETTSVAPQLNYITYIILELKVELPKIKTEVNEIEIQLSVIYLSLVNEIRNSKKFTLSNSTPF